MIASACSPASASRRLVSAAAALTWIALTACSPGGQGPKGIPGSDPSVSTVPRPAADTHEDGEYLFYVARDGIHRRDVATDVDVALPGTRDAGSLAPAPGGGRVAYVRSSGPGGGFVDEIWVAEANGDEEPRRLVDPAGVSGTRGTPASTPAHLREPQWSPDGSRIALAAGDGEARMLVVVDSATGHPATVPSPRPVGVFSWSPDGGSVLYTTATGPGPVDVASVSVTDGLTRVWAQGLYATSVAWDRNGAAVVVTTGVGQTGRGGVVELGAAGGPPHPLVQEPAAAPYGAAAVLSDGAVAFTVGEASPTRPRLLQTLERGAVGRTPRSIADDVGGPRGDPRWSDRDRVAYGASGAGGVLVVDDAAGESRIHVSSEVSAFAWAPPTPADGGSAPSDTDVRG